MDKIEIPKGLLPLKATLSSLFKEVPLMGWKCYANLDSTKVVLDFGSSNNQTRPIKLAYRPINDQQQKRSTARAKKSRTKAKGTSTTAAPLTARS